MLYLNVAAAGPLRYGLGRPADNSDLEKRGFLIGPRGEGLPPGRGSVTEGRAIYLVRCAVCHGVRGKGVSDFPALAGGAGTLRSEKPLQTVGSFWPYATTVWDYVNRAMPYQSPGTLRTDEVYALTAYILAMNGVMPGDAVLDQNTLPAIRMPNRDGFIADPRPDVK